MLNAWGAPGDPEKACELLLWYGVVGIGSREGTEKFIYDYEYNLKRMNAEIAALKGEVLYVVNPAFHIGLEDPIKSGDASLADFSSVVAAVDCEVGVWRQQCNSNARIPNNKCLQFRIEVNLGKVTVDRRNIYKQNRSAALAKRHQFMAVDP